MGNAHATPDRTPLKDRLELEYLACRLPHLEVLAMDCGDTGRVVSPILEPA
jgi:hypothetical protein